MEVRQGDNIIISANSFKYYYVVNYVDANGYIYATPVPGEYGIDVKIVNINNTLTIPSYDKPHSILWTRSNSYNSSTGVTPMDVVYRTNNTTSYITPIVDNSNLVIPTQNNITPELIPKINSDVSSIKYNRLNDVTVSYSRSGDISSCQVNPIQIHDIMTNTDTLAPLNSGLLQLNNNETNPNIIDLQNSTPSDYTLLKLIGKGSSGDVYSAKFKDIDTEIVVKKMVYTNETTGNIFRGTSAIAVSLKHRNIVDTYAYITTNIKDKGNVIDNTEDNGEVWLIMEMLSGGDLGDKIEYYRSILYPYHTQLGPKSLYINYTNPLQDIVHKYSDFIGYTLYNILSGIKYMHGKGLIHRDIKPGNIILTSDNNSKISDFDLIRISSSKPSSCIKGTLGYIPPESLSVYSVTPKVDIWAIGIIGYIMITFTQPYDRDNLQIYKTQVLNNPAPNVRTKYQVQVSNDLFNVINYMLIKDPNMRPTADMVLNTPYFRTIKQVYNL